MDRLEVARATFEWSMTTSTTTGQSATSSRLRRRGEVTGELFIAVTVAMKSSA
jgi:hypothetical protein